MGELDRLHVLAAEALDRFRQNWRDPEAVSVTLVVRDRSRPDGAGDVVVTDDELFLVVRALKQTAARVGEPRRDAAWAKYLELRRRINRADSFEEGSRLVAEAKALADEFDFEVDRG